MVWPDKYINEVLAPPVDQRGHLAAFEIIATSANQRETVTRQIFDRRRKIQLGIEPGFYRVLVSRDDVQQVVAFERPHVAGEDFRCDSLVTRRCPKTGCPLPTTKGSQGEQRKGAGRLPHI